MTFARGFQCKLRFFVDTKGQKWFDGHGTLAIEPNWGSFQCSPDLASVNCVIILAIAHLGAKSKDA